MTCVLQGICTNSTYVCSRQLLLAGEWSRQILWSSNSLGL